jgi:hypothetical protein
MKVVSANNINEEAKNLKPGDILYIENGTYELDIKIECHGEENKPIIIQSQEQGKVVFVEKTTLDINGSHIIFSGFNFNDCNINKSVKLRGEYNRITNCVWNRLKQSVESIIRIEGKYNRFDHNEIKHIEKNLGVLVLVYRDSDAENYACIDHNHFHEVTTVPVPSNSQSQPSVPKNYDELCTSLTQYQAQRNQVILHDGQVVVLANRRELSAFEWQVEDAYQQ